MFFGKLYTYKYILAKETDLRIGAKVRKKAYFLSGKPLVNIGLVAITRVVHIFFLPHFPSLRSAR